MKKAIEFLKTDRKVNDTFKSKLEKIGLEIQYGKYNYWDNQEYVQIGRTKVWLVCSKTNINDHSTYVTYRYQNNIIKDIEEVVQEEYTRAGKADNQVNEFFIKLGFTE